VRHGQYKTHEEHDANQNLTPLGKIQANMVGKRLKEILFDHIYVSNLSRAIETCDIVTSNFDSSIKIQMDPDLAEGNLFFLMVKCLETLINERFSL
jgi:broad specificity phosphatase PhoE